MSPEPLGGFFWTFSALAGFVAIMVYPPIMFVLALVVARMLWRSHRRKAARHRAAADKATDKAWRDLVSRI